MDQDNVLDKKETTSDTSKNSLLRKLEVFLYLMMIVGVIFWKFHLPMTAIILIISPFLLSILYFFGFTLLINKIPGRKAFSKASYAGKSKVGIIVGVVAGVLLQFSVLGLLFGMQQWPLWVTFCTIGAPMAIVFGLVGAGFMAKKGNEFGLPLMKRSVILAVGCFLILLFHVEIEAERYGTLKPLFYDIHECLESGEAHCENDKSILQFSLVTLWGSVESPDSEAAVAKLNDLALKYKYEIVWDQDLAQTSVNRPIGLNKLD